MSNFEFVLILGDLHIPNKVFDIPQVFKEYFDSGKI